MLKQFFLPLLLVILSACESEENRLVRTAQEKQDSLAMANASELALEMRNDTQSAREEIQMLNRQLLEERLQELKDELEIQINELTELKKKKKSFKIILYNKQIDELKAKISDIELELK